MMLNLNCNTDANLAYILTKTWLWAITFELWQWYCESCIL